MAEAVALSLLLLMVSLTAVGTAIAIHWITLDQRKRRELPSERHRRRYELTGNLDDLEAMKKAIEEEQKWDGSS